MIEFVVEGVPVSKLRPRVTRTHTYTPKKTRDYEKLVQWSYKNKYKDEPLEGALSIEIDLDRKSVV